MDPSFEGGLHVFGNGFTGVPRHERRISLEPCGGFPKLGGPFSGLLLRNFV